MEARATYGPQRERPRLTVVNDGAATYSALPHDIMRDTSLSRDARLLYAILQGHWWQGGECWAGHATLAAEMGCTDRHLRRFIRELLKAGKISERRRGHGQAKAYAPTESSSQQDESVRLNGTESSAFAPNRTDLSAQQDESVRFNRTDLSDLKKTPEEDSLKEEDTGVGNAARAAPAPRAGRATSKAGPRRQRLPEDWALTAAHREAAAKRGLDAARAETEAEKFCDYHRAKGTVMLDWMAAWRTWCGNALRFGAPGSGAARSNGTPPAPGGRSSAKWDGWNGRHGMTVSRAEGYEDDR